MYIQILGYGYLTGQTDRLIQIHAGTALNEETSSCTPQQMANLIANPSIQKYVQNNFSILKNVLLRNSL